MLLIGTTTWGQISRSRTLRSYDKRLTLALRAFEKHNRSGTPTSIPETIQGFTQGSIKPSDMKTIAGQWEQDVTSSGDAIAKLTPPRELKSAQTIFQQVMDDYVGVARLAVVAADLRILTDRASKAQKSALANQAKALLAQLDESRQRAEKLRGIAQTQLVNLRVDWGVNNV